MPNDDAPDPSGDTSTGIEQGDSNTLITIHVKSLRGEDFEMTVPRDVQVSDLKTRVRERTGVEEVSNGGAIEVPGRDVTSHSDMDVLLLSAVAHDGLPIL